jgi:hypothetical protein
MNLTLAAFSSIVMGGGKYARWTAFNFITKSTAPARHWCCCTGRIEHRDALEA